MKIFDKHFGKLSSLILLIGIFISNSKVFNLSDLKAYINFNSYLFISIGIMFFVAQYYLFEKYKIGFKIGLLVLLFNLQALFISKFLHLVELDNTSPDISLLDKNAALGMSWIIIVPVLLILFFTLGIIFDYFRKHNFTNRNL